MFPREPTSKPQLRFESLRFGNRVDWDREDWDSQEVQCDRFHLFCEFHELGSFDPVPISDCREDPLSWIGPPVSTKRAT